MHFLPGAKGKAVDTNPVCFAMVKCTAMAMCMTVGCSSGENKKVEDTTKGTQAVNTEEADASGDSAELKIGRIELDLAMPYQQADEAAFE